MHLDKPLLSLIKHVKIGRGDFLGKIIFVTGGARSGKSTFAENYVKNIGNNITYIATMNYFDDEMKERIAHHQKRRDDKFSLVEAYKDFNIVFQEISSESCVLFDCLTNMINALFFENELDFENLSPYDFGKLEQNIEKQCDILINTLKTHPKDSVIVSNELGLGLVPPYALGRYFRDIAGRMNQKFASEADEVYFIVSGIPLKIKG